MIRKTYKFISDNFLPLVMAVFSVLWFIYFSLAVIKPLKVSLPEEIILAKKGDTLIVERVSDSIYIGFKR